MSTDSKPNVPSASGPLSGVRVVEAAEFVSGPVGGGILADLGADVVKVERPGRGDALRGYGLRKAGLSAMWLTVNRSKRSVQLDLKDQADRERLLSLTAKADVFVQNWRPGVAASLGLDDATLAAGNPSLIRVAVSGFGPSGPRMSEPVFDSVVQAVSGVASTQGRNGRPETVAAVLIDKVAGMVVAQSVLAALFERSSTGKGRCLEISMLDSAAYFNFPDLFQDATFVGDERRITEALSPVAATSDGHLVVAPMSGRDLERMGDAFGHPEWKDTLATISNPGELGRTMAAFVESATKEMPTMEALAILKGADIATAQVLDRDQHLVDAQVLHNQIYRIESHPVLGEVRTVRYPTYFDGEPQQAPVIAASAGQHTDEVFEEWLSGGSM